MAALTPPFFGPKKGGVSAGFLVVHRASPGRRSLRTEFLRFAGKDSTVRSFTDQRQFLNWGVPGR